MRPAEHQNNPLPYNPGAEGPVFTLHDGPPYANGKLHMGHALNKLLKDMVLRDKRRQGFHAELLANWDCHGLPLEQRFAGKRERFSTTTSYLAVVEAEARKWARVQSDALLELGVSYDPSESSLSCDPERQALVMSEFHRMVSKGLVSRRGHPSSWSPMDGTVLAGAETVEVEHNVPTATVLFPLRDPVDGLEAYLAVWTTTPWSLPGNAGVAYNPDLEYFLHQVEDKYVVALSQFLKGAEPVRTLGSEEMAEMRPQHPLHEAGYPLGMEMPPLMAAGFVSSDKGTGLVHVGPAHAMEDYALWKGLYDSAPFPDVVNSKGRYLDNLPLFGGLTVVEGNQQGQANDAVLKALEERGMLLETVNTTMTLEASWRSGGLLVTRPTDQWFVDLKDARSKAVKAVEDGDVQMVPERSRSRFLSMLRTRPDWLVSRQREWGVPLGLYVNKATGMPETDEALLYAVQNMVKTKGLAGWWDVTPAEHFAAAGRTDHEDFEKVTDVLDVWFDSACVQNYGQGPADLVVEGSDQHRGWYSSSLLKATCLDDPLPFRTVLTHGFVVDSERRKMSKSTSNGTTPEEALRKWKRDVLRLWVAHVDVTEDVPFSDKVLEEAAQARKSMRNTMRYLTAVLRDWTVDDSNAVSTWGPDLLLLAELDDLVAKCNQALDSYDMRKRMELVRDFLDHRMSGLHLDARKDRLYCEAGTVQWHGTRSVLMKAYSVLLELLEPLCPDLVAEMKEACKPEETNGTSSQQWLTYVEPLKSASSKVAKLCAEAGLKPKDVTLQINASNSKDLAEMMDVFGADGLARLLKVDLVVLAKQTTVTPSVLPECPRCRLHHAPDTDSWCKRCDEYHPDKQNA
jgi:isoleucyl-tRNA synthetase